MKETLQEQKALTREDIGIHFYFKDYEFADGYIYFKDDIFRNIYDLEIKTKEQGEAYDEYLKDYFEGETEEYFNENIDKCILEFSYLEY